MCDHITQLNIVKEEPTKKLLFSCLIYEYLSSCLIAQYSSDIIVLDLGEKKVTKKAEADIRKASEAKARARQSPKPSKSKQPIPIFTLTDH